MTSENTWSEKAHHLSDASEGGLDVPTQNAIGKRMQQNAAYIVAEPLPDQLVALLEKLKLQEAARGKQRPKETSADAAATR